MELHYLFLVQFLAVLVYRKNIIGGVAWLRALPFWIHIFEGGKDILNITEHGDHHLTMNSLIYIRS